MDGKIVAVYGNLVVAETSGTVVQNSTAYCVREDGTKLLSETIRVRGNQCDLQVFEETRGLKVGNSVEFNDEMLSVTLGPGLLGQIYDGLQNPLVELSKEAGFFLKPGNYLPGLKTDVQWDFTPVASVGDTVAAGDTLGTVMEGLFTHKIMVPFNLEVKGEMTVESIESACSCTVEKQIATVKDSAGETYPVTLQQKWPVKRALNVSEERLMPESPMVTQTRIIDTTFPVVLGGTFCVPGPFGAGKTVLQQMISRYADVDVVIVAACGERAGEVVETLREFPELEDPRTGKPLMERTIIICNTSAMPVAAREASVYTAATLGEYYRQMGLNVLLLADSTSRWAQAMREVSGRLEEIPGEEAFPAYLESKIASFYERAAIVRFKDGTHGSLTIGGTVSPAGGNFEEPVTQGTLKVVGAFLGLSRARSDARRFPAIDPLDSWTKYSGIIPQDKINQAVDILRRGNEIKQMMTVVGEEGTSTEDFTTMHKAEFFDSVYLQQNAFDAVDSACPGERQKFVFDKVLGVMTTDYAFEDKETARKTMVGVTDTFRNWNYEATGTDEYNASVAKIEKFLETKGRM